MSPEISVLLPVFNGSAYLEQQIESLLGQSFADLEVVAYDDGSSDDSLAVLERLAAKDGRLRVHREEANLGQNAALRWLLANSTGRLVAFSDQDDIWHHDKLASLRAAMDGVALAYGRSLLVDAGGRELGLSLTDVVSSTIEGRDDARILLWNSVSGHAMLVEREIIDPGVFLFQRPYDWLIASVATFSKGIRFVPDAITYHRLHGANQVNAWMLTGRKKAAQRRRGWRHGLSLMLESLLVLAGSAALPAEKRRIFMTMADLVSREANRILPSPTSFTFRRRFMGLVGKLTTNDAVHTSMVTKLRQLRPLTAWTYEWLRAHASGTLVVGANRTNERRDESTR